MLSRYIACIMNGVYLGQSNLFKKTHKYNLSYDGQMTYFTLEGILETLNNDDISGRILIKNIYKYYMMFYYVQRHEMPNLNKNEELIYTDICNYYKDQKPLRIERDSDKEVMEILEKGKVFSRNLVGNKLNNSSALLKLSPLIIFSQNPKLAFKIGVELTALTHGDNEAQICGGAFVYILSRLANKDNLIDIIEDCIEEIKELKEGINVVKNLQLFLEHIDNETPITSLNTKSLNNVSYEILLYSLLIYNHFEDDYSSALDFIEDLPNSKKEIAILYGNLYGSYYNKLLFNNENDIDFYSEFVDKIEELYKASLQFNEE